MRATEYVKRAYVGVPYYQCRGGNCMLNDDLHSASELRWTEDAQHGMRRGWVCDACIEYCLPQDWGEVEVGETLEAFLRVSAR